MTAEWIIKRQKKEGEIEMSLYFGVFISLFAYLIGMEVKEKIRMASVKPAARRDHPCDRILKSDRDQLYRLQHR